MELGKAGKSEIEIRSARNGILNTGEVTRKT